MLNDLWQDLSYGVRLLRKTPGFTLVAALSLALGIGANTAIFSVIDVLMLRKLPVWKPEQLVMFRYDDPSPRADFYRYNFNYPQFERFRERNQEFDGIVAIGLFDRSGITINRSEADPLQTRVALVSGNYFSMLGVNAALGRTFTESDDRTPGGHPVAIISDAYWERQFSRARDVVGQTLTLNNTTYTIIGVAPLGFEGDWVGRPVDLWMPAMMYGQVMPEAPGPGLQRFPVRIIARLKTGVTVGQALAATQLVFHEGKVEDLGPNPSPQQLQQVDQFRLTLRPAAHGYSPQRDAYAQSLAILMAMVGLVLLIACANVANLLLARSTARQKEMAVRLALGARRARIVRQMLAESLLLAVMGGTIGLLFAVWGTSVLSTISLSPVQTDARAASAWISFDLSPDGRVFLFTTAICLLTAFLFGLAPAFRGSRVSLSPALTGRGADASSTSGRFGLGKALVVTQVALSLVLLVGAGLLVRTLHNLRATDLGADRQHVMLVWSAPGQTSRQGPKLADLCHTVQERLSSVTGVVSASMSSRGLLTGNDGGAPSATARVEGQAPKAGLFLGRTAVVPGYFETVGMPFLSGRDFTERDNESAPKVTIINETLARFFFDDQNPVARRIALGDDDTPLEIVGVVKDAKEGTVQGKGGMAYGPYRQLIGLMRTMCIVVRTSGNPTGLSTQVRQTLLDIDPNLHVLKITTIEDQLNDVLAQERLIAGLASAFGALAMVLACLGLYGVISYSVARRNNEIGIRLSLGAAPGAMMRMVLRESLVLVMVGITLGLPVTLASARVISTKLFGISPADPLTTISAVLVMIAVSALAAFLPARRAARVDPMVALRSE
ncbi:MAG TPA: ABC transporter permease [Blastocatellia bacterium]|nr:ABC transporter permease [Blastocatellia bacterium]